jgi:PDZ domain-containing secreted protein
METTPGAKIAYALEYEKGINRFGDSVLAKSERSNEERFARQGKWNRTRKLVGISCVANPNRDGSSHVTRSISPIGGRSRCRKYGVA